MEMCPEVRCFPPSRHFVFDIIIVHGAVYDTKGHSEQIQHFPAVIYKMLLLKAEIAMASCKNRWFANLPRFYIKSQPFED